MGAGLAMTAVKRSRVRLLIVTMLFIATTINYADRATLSIAGPSLAKDLGLDAVAMGYVFSAFAWSYVLAQLPAAGCSTATARSGSMPARSSCGRPSR